MICRADLHVHTDASMDGLSSLARQAAAARAAGLDAMAVTDHNRCAALPDRLEGVLLIPGCEVSTQAGHILGLFLEGPLDLEILRAGGLPTGEAAVEEIHRRGGLAVLAHPYASPSAAPEKLSLALDGVEAANARAAFKAPDANRQAAALAKGWGLAATGGSDGHRRHEVGNAYTELTCGELTLPELKEALKRGDCRPVLKRNTPCFRKGLSQLGKARRQKSARALVRGLAYLAYCCGKDLLRLPQARFRERSE